MTGIEMIAQERERQVTVEGYHSDHDDEHFGGELALAAACYAVPMPIYTIEFCGDGDTHPVWPWGEELQEKRDAHPAIRRLTIAGALIAAELDRLIRASNPIVAPHFPPPLCGVRCKADGDECNLPAGHGGKCAHDGITYSGCFKE